MRILVNGAWRETVAAELSSVLQELGYGEAVVATAVNGEFVAAGTLPRTRLPRGALRGGAAPLPGGGCRRPSGHRPGRGRWSAPPRSRYLPRRPPPGAPRRA